jgi:electron transport complex protein RnfG|tara:strand:- start:1650 stop:2306 length:657 start_codon:yes stop_codon:yes gene_type:complete
VLGKSIASNSVLLGIFALITAGVLAGTKLATNDRIAAAERAAAQKALLQIVPLERHNNDILVDTHPIPAKYWADLGLKDGGDINLARDQGKIIAAIIPAIAPDGYSGNIGMMIGVNIDGTLAGVRVLTHTETPGLGDKVDLKKSDWILSFNGKSLSYPRLDGWAVKKDGGDFDAFTGATITPRAVVQAVKRTLQFFDQIKPTLLKSKVVTTNASEAKQ